MLVLHVMAHAAGLSLLAACALHALRLPRAALACWGLCAVSTLTVAALFLVHGILAAGCAP